jgi:hypothetical protein
VFLDHPLTRRTTPARTKAMMRTMTTTKDSAAPATPAGPPPAPRHEPASLPLRGPAEAHTGVSTNTLYRLYARDEIVLFKVGRRTLLDTASWRAFQARAPRAPRGAAA